ncbi:hypothetical protein GCM10025875_07190 [Litorihabitans aurantiacus]|uniref:Lipoprotein n=1 Tax=Litorihabitans aurantiacus TaxID=1930061 RepID=A0AA37UWR7_9MICO|nr:hypothetical protein GCM10025875_07190 [Litorihabitans aurantiacus]
MAMRRLKHCLIVVATLAAVAGCGSLRGESLARESALVEVAFKHEGAVECVDALDFEATRGGNASSLFDQCFDLSFASGVPEGTKVSDVSYPDGWGWVTSITSFSASYKASVTTTGVGHAPDITNLKVVAASCFSITITDSEPPAFRDEECGPLADIVDGFPDSRVDPSIAEVIDVIERTRAAD